MANLVRHAVLYTLAIGAGVTGIWLVFRDDRPADVPPPVVAATPGEAGGYMGTGRPQVRFEGTARQVSDPRPKGHSSEVQTPAQLDALRRMESLRHVLDNLEGEPVYVEGIDGPAPDKRPKR